ncbi:MAG: hypothetical protein JNJ89_11280 [Rubrivivax sp.]|nr:hypothetical protein [Rubrivivax sp.]
MDLLSALSLAVGVCLVALVAVAMLVAGWELLRQRELLDQLRRDRAVYAATSPLPLVGSRPPTEGPAGAAPAAGPPQAGTTASPATGPAAAAAEPPRREANWTETRPMVLRFAPAADDNTAPRPRTLDLTLD